VAEDEVAERRRPNNDERDENLEAVAAGHTREANNW